MHAVAGGDARGKLCLWHISTGRPLAMVPAHEGACWELAISPDGNRVATAGKDGHVKVWEVAKLLAGAEE